jgi:hypothetical protein
MFHQGKKKECCTCHEAFATELPFGCVCIFPHDFTPQGAGDCWRLLEAGAGIWKVDYSAALQMLQHLSRHLNFEQAKMFKYTWESLKKPPKCFT